MLFDQIQHAGRVEFRVPEDAGSCLLRDERRVVLAAGIYHNDFIAQVGAEEVL
jgi:hypothetical protein